MLQLLFVKVELCDPSILHCPAPHRLSLIDCWCVFTNVKVHRYSVPVKGSGLKSSKKNENNLRERLKTGAHRSQLDQSVSLDSFGHKWTWRLQYNRAETFYMKCSLVSSVGTQRQSVCCKNGGGQYNTQCPLVVSQKQGWWPGSGGTVDCHCAMWAEHSQHFSLIGSLAIVKSFVILYGMFSPCCATLTRYSPCAAIDVGEVMMLPNNMYCYPLGAVKLHENKPLSLFLALLLQCKFPSSFVHTQMDLCWPVSSFIEKKMDGKMSKCEFGHQIGFILTGVYCHKKCPVFVLSIPFCVRCGRLLWSHYRTPAHFGTVLVSHVQQLGCHSPAHELVFDLFVPSAPLQLRRRHANFSPRSHQADGSWLLTRTRKLSLNHRCSKCKRQKKTLIWWVCTDWHVFSSWAPTNSSWRPHRGLLFRPSQCCVLPKHDAKHIQLNIDICHLIC